MIATCPSAILLGVDGQIVHVEVHVSRGLPAFTVVGLPDAAVRESRDRVRAALLSSSLPWPRQRVTVNLAPSDLRKTGSSLDLAIALGLLLASGEVPAASIAGTAVIGELGLDGSVRAVPGVLVLADGLRRAGFDTAIVPAESAAEARLVTGLGVRPARSLAELRACLLGECPWPAIAAPPVAPGARPGEPRAAHAGFGLDDPDSDGLDLADVRGLPVARRALEVAAAGAHHLLLAGPPGAGKTMLARRLPTILPPLSPAEALEVTRIRSAFGESCATRLARHRPFCAPHHTASTPALVGGGTARPRPGAVTRAHHGVLFLDELGEFHPQALEALRQPLEERVVRIARQPHALTFPADCLLVACTNPCPCGRGGPGCQCSDAQRLRYRARLSAPLLDRFDLRVYVQPPRADDPAGEPSATVRARVDVAVARQAARYADWPWSRNAHVPAGALDHAAPLPADALAAWKTVCEQRRLSGRGAARVRRVARTLADLDDRAVIAATDVHLAASLRDDVP